MTRILSALALFSVIFSTFFWAASDVAAATITFDAVTASTGTASDVTPHTFTHTVTGSGADRILVVGVSVASKTVTVTAVSYNSVALSQPANCTAASVGTASVSMWYLLNPGTGSALTMSVTTSASIEVSVGAISYTNVVQAAPTCGGGIDAATTTAITSATNTQVIATLATTDTGTITINGGQTARWASGAAVSVQGAGSTEAGSTSKTCARSANLGHFGA